MVEIDGLKGVQFREANPEKPDGLYLEAPPDEDPNDPNIPPLYDYANDVEPSLNPDQDKGLQLLRQENKRTKVTHLHNVMLSPK